MPKISNKHYDIVLKKQVLEKLEIGMKPKETATFFGLDVAAVYRWRSSARKKGILEKKEKSQRRCKLR